MSAYTDELNALLNKGFSYDSAEVQLLQNKYLASGDFRPSGKQPVYARIARSQEDQRQLNAQMKRQAEAEAEQAIIDKYNAQ